MISNAQIVYGKLVFVFVFLALNSKVRFLDTGDQGLLVEEQEDSSKEPTYHVGSYHVVIKSIATVLTTITAISVAELFSRTDLTLDILPLKEETGISVVVCFCETIFILSRE